MQINKEIDEGRFFALISYISFLCIVSLLFKKDNKFVLYHAKQGLVLFVFEVVVYILSRVAILAGLAQLCFVLAALVSIWGIVQVWMGNDCRIVLVSDIADKINI
jgi:uncharacterized membrane protein